MGAIETVPHRIEWNQDGIPTYLDGFPDFWTALSYARLWFGNDALDAERVRLVPEYDPHEERR